MYENVKEYLEASEDILQSKDKTYTIFHLRKQFNLTIKEAEKLYYDWKKSFLKSNKCVPINRYKIAKKEDEWELEDLEFLRKNWGKMNSFIISERLEKSYKEIKEKAKKLGLKPLPGAESFKGWSHEEENKIIELKNKFKTYKEIAEILGRSSNSISIRLSKLRGEKKEDEKREHKNDFNRIWRRRTSYPTRTRV